MPSIFVGHGSPMNALQDNHWTQALSTLSRSYSRPRSIVVVSAHWETRGIQVQASAQPTQIYDFYGFPEPLYQVRYQPKGDPTLASTIRKLLPGSTLTHEWGLDHGAWCVLKHLYPNADIPVVSVSLGRERTDLEHFNTGRNLAALRDQNILLIFSGNIVHNLRALTWGPDSKPADWATRFESEAFRISTDPKNLRNDWDPTAILASLRADADFKRAHPTVEHYLPWVLWLGSRRAQDRIETLTPGVEHHSISMAGWIASSSTKS
jgi:4,5-DOPA dioxygenase extradiol